RKDDRTRSLRGITSRNKVSVGEPAEGSLKTICLSPGLGACLETSFSQTPVEGVLGRPCVERSSLRVAEMLAAPPETKRRPDTG
ncbi:hypothetical protein NPIL_2431, partial [Nephila pilipes]